MKTTIKAKIISVRNVLSSHTAKGTTRSVIMSVVELTDNPFGHTPKEVNPFDVLVYNHHIENFNISPTLAGESCSMELIMTATGPKEFRSIVNDLTFRI